MKTLDFSGKTVLVTGATRGIGKAIAEAFEENHATLILTGTQKNVIETLNSQFPDRAYLCVDFTDKTSRQSFLNTIEDMNIDICINCAGANLIKHHLDCTEEEYDFIHDLNLKAPYLISQKVAAGMKKRGWGRIVNISSIWGSITKGERSLYSSSKTGLIGMSRSLAVDLAPDILVNSLSPGFTETELTAKSLSADEKNRLCSQVPLGRFAQPVEIAQTVLFLASEMNTYITGQNLNIDGGFTIV